VPRGYGTDAVLPWIEEPGIWFTEWRKEWEVRTSSLCVSATTDVATPYYHFGISNSTAPMRVGKPGLQFSSDGAKFKVVRDGLTLVSVTTVPQIKTYTVAVVDGTWVFVLGILNETPILVVKYKLSTRPKSPRSFAGLKYSSFAFGRYVDVAACDAAAVLDAWSAAPQAVLLPSCERRPSAAACADTAGCLRCRGTKCAWFGNKYGCRARSFCGVEDRTHCVAVLGCVWRGGRCTRR